MVGVPRFLCAKTFSKSKVSSSLKNSTQSGEAGGAPPWWGFWPLEIEGVGRQMDGWIDWLSDAHGLVQGSSPSMRITFYGMATTGYGPPPSQGKWTFCFGIPAPLNMKHKFWWSLAWEGIIPKLSAVSPFFWAMRISHFNVIPQVLECLVRSLGAIFQPHLFFLESTCFCRFNLAKQP